MKALGLYFDPWFAAIFMRPFIMDRGREHILTWLAVRCVTSPAPRLHGCHATIPFANDVALISSSPSPAAFPVVQPREVYTPAVGRARIMGRLCVTSLTSSPTPPALTQVSVPPSNQLEPEEEQEEFFEVLYNNPEFDFCYGAEHYFDAKEEFPPAEPSSQVPSTLLQKVSKAVGSTWNGVWGGIRSLLLLAFSLNSCLLLAYSLLLYCSSLFLQSYPTAWQLLSSVSTIATYRTTQTFTACRRWFCVLHELRHKSSTHKHRTHLTQPRTPPYQSRPQSWLRLPGVLSLLKVFAFLWLLSSAAVSVAAVGHGLASVPPSPGFQVAVQYTSVYGAFCGSVMHLNHTQHVDPSTVPYPPWDWDPSVHASWSHVQTTTPDGLQYHARSSAFTKDPDGGWIMGNHPDMSPEETEALRATIAAHKGDFAYDLSQLGTYCGEVGPFRISLKHDDPIRTPPRRHSFLENQVVQEKCGELDQHHIIIPAGTSTKYISRPTVAAKKDLEGEWTEKRFCVDYRRINDATEDDKYGMHTPEELFDQVKGNGFFTKLDLRSGFHQIPLLPEDQVKTGFWWNNQIYQYTCMPFGLKNASAHFQRCMDAAIISHRLTDCALCYVDDVLIYSPTAKQHVADVDKVFTMLHDIGMKAHPDKSVFGTDVIEFLGHNVSAYGTTPHEAKTAAIWQLPAPRNEAELRSFIGLLNYYRGYVPGFASTAQPLYKLLKKDAPFIWTDEQQQAFESLKATICTEGQALRRFHPERETILYTDWSTLGIGAVLAQKGDDGKEYMVACISRSLNKHEAQYASYYGEMLAAVWGIKTLRPYLHGVHFRVVTDHRPLTYLVTNNNLTGQHARWALSLQEYDFTIEYRKGADHANADVPSRFPLPSHEDGTGARLDNDPEDLEGISPAPPPPQQEAHLHSTFSSHDLHWAYTQPPVSSVGWELLPDASQLLLGHLGMICDSSDAAGLTYAPTGQDQQHIRSWARHAVRHAAQSFGPEFWKVPPDRPSLISSIAVAGDFWIATRTEGIILMETFAGIATGLEMCLRNGIKVQQYLYCDSDPVAQRTAQHRAWLLHEQYPALLPVDALRHAFVALPSNITLITPAILATLVKEMGPAHWFYVAGWECQDLSPAGSGAGLAGRRSSTFFACANILQSLQQLMRPSPCLLAGKYLHAAPLCHI